MIGLVSLLVAAGQASSPDTRKFIEYGRTRILDRGYPEDRPARQERPCACPQGESRRLITVFSRMSGGFLSALADIHINRMHILFAQVVKLWHSSGREGTH